MVQMCRTAGAHSSLSRPSSPRYAYVIKCTGVSKDGSGRVVELQAEADLEPAGKKPPKGILNWVAQPKPGQEPARAEVGGWERERGQGRRPPGPRCVG